MEQQLWPTKQGDGTVTERHVYGGPQGEGYVDIVYRKQGAKLQVKRTHVGPEDRPSHDFEDVNESDGEKPVRMVLDDKGQWTNGRMKLMSPVTVELPNGLDGSTVRNEDLTVNYKTNLDKSNKAQFKLTPGENTLTIYAVAEGKGFTSDPTPVTFKVTYVPPGG